MQDGPKRQDSEIVAVAGLPAEEATWPPNVVNGSGRITVAANSLGMAVNLSVMQIDHGPGITRATKPVSQSAGFDPNVARRIAWQLIAAADWVEGKR
jgi:hypothetical protein